MDDTWGLVFNEKRRGSGRRRREEGRAQRNIRGFVIIRNITERLNSSLAVGLELTVGASVIQRTGIGYIAEQQDKCRVDK